MANRRSYSSDKDLANFIRHLVAAGWTFRRGGRHNRVISPNGRIVIVPSSPSDRRSLQNLKCWIARHLREVPAPH